MRTKKKNSLIGAVTVLATIFIISITASGIGNAAETQKVTLPNWGWSGDFLPVYLMKILLEQKLGGYAVNTVELSDVASAISTDSGETQVNLFLWFPNSLPALQKYLDKGSIVNLGPLCNDLPEGMFVPSYFAEKYGIRSIKDLNDPEVAKLLDFDNDGKGDWVGCDPGWACAPKNDEVIAAYGLDKLFQQKVGGSHLLKAAVVAKLKKKEPVVMFNFWPNDIFIEYPRGDVFTKLEDPLKLYTVCYVPKLVNKKWLDENPKAGDLLRQMKITGEDVMWFMKQVQENGDDPATLEALAQEWIDQNEDTVDGWINAID
jgi:glycine betaine/proline transport system substrate-binding protein